MFVTEIIPDSNTVVLGTINDLQKQQMSVRNVNLVKYPTLTEPTTALTKIRYKDPGTMSSISLDGTTMNVTFHKPVTGIAPGQSAVFYEGDDVIGGGFINSQNKNLS